MLVNCWRFFLRIRHNNNFYLLKKCRKTFPSRSEAMGSNFLSRHRKPHSFRSIGLVCLDKAPLPPKSFFGGQFVPSYSLEWEKVGTLLSYRARHFVRLRPRYLGFHVQAVPVIYRLRDTSYSFESLGWMQRWYFSGSKPPLPGISQPEPQVLLRIRDSRFPSRERQFS